MTVTDREKGDADFSNLDVLGTNVVTRNREGNEFLPLHEARMRPNNGRGRLPKNKRREGEKNLV